MDAIVNQPEPLCFVVLHHQGVEQPHYDLMFETSRGSALRTFRLPRWPVDGEMEVESLAQHRREYLTYEGLVSNNRGFVTHIATGTLTIETREADFIRLFLESQIASIIELEKTDRWRVRPVAL